MATTTAAELETQFRRVQATSSCSFSVVLPKNFVAELGLTAGNYVKCSKEGRRIVIEPVEGGGQ